MSQMDAARFLADLHAKPSVLRALADAIDDGAMRWPIEHPPARLVLAGMGSSWFAAQTMALRFRRAGITAVGELSSADTSWPPGDDTLVIAISASGGSSETIEFASAHPGLVALTNVADSLITRSAAHVVAMLAGPELGGVACRSYQHTLIALLGLEQQLTGRALHLADTVRRSADAAQSLLDNSTWLEQVCTSLDGPHGVYLLAPADRISSALQGALMIREGPRRQADGCETGDWSHVDVYLTKTLDYRALMFTGSRHDAAARTWLTGRASTIVSVGIGAVGDAVNVRFPGDDDPIVALLTESLVPELVAARWWTERHDST